MMSINLEKNLEYFKVQKSLRSENFTELYLCIKGQIDMFFSTSKHISQAKHEISH